MFIKRELGVVGSRFFEILFGVFRKVFVCYLGVCVYIGIGWVLGEGLGEDVGLVGLK